MKTLQIVGRKKSGKTGLIVDLIPRLQRRGLRVGSVKHSTHPYPLDREGTDSWRHREAGAEFTMMITAAAVSLHFAAPEDPGELERLIDRYFGSMDIVLIEGWTGRPGPRIEVLPADGAGNPREPRGAGDLIAVVLAPGVEPAPDGLAAMGLTHESRRDSTSGLPCFYWRDMDAIAEFVVDFLRSAQ